MENWKKEINLSIANGESKKCIRALLKKYHPDNKETGDDKIFKEIKNYEETLVKAIGKLDNINVPIVVKKRKEKKTLFTGKFYEEGKTETLKSILEEIFKEYEKDIKVSIKEDTRYLSINIEYLNIPNKFDRVLEIDLNKFIDYIEMTPNISNRSSDILNNILYHSKYNYIKSEITTIDPIIKFYIGKDDTICETRETNVSITNKISDYLDKYVNNEIELSEIDYKYFTTNTLCTAMSKKDEVNLNKYLKKNKPTKTEWKEFIEVVPSIILLDAFTSKDKKLINEALIKKPYLFYLDKFKKKFPTMTNFIKGIDLEISKLINILTDKSSTDMDIIKLLQEDSSLLNLTKGSVKPHLSDEVLSKVNSNSGILINRIYNILSKSKYNSYSKVISNEILNIYKDNQNIHFAFLAFKALCSEKVSKESLIKILKVTNIEDIVTVYNNLFDMNKTKIPKGIIRKDLDIFTTYLEKILE